MDDKTKVDPMFPESPSTEESALGFAEAIAEFSRGEVGPRTSTKVVLCELGEGKLAVKVRRPPDKPGAGTIEYAIWDSRDAKWVPPPMSLGELRESYGLPRSS